MKITSTEVKNSFGKYLRLCRTEPVYITKNGEVIAKLVDHVSDQECSYERVNEAITEYEVDRLRMSFDEFEKMNDESTIRLEYINGEVYMLSAPGVSHQRIISRLHVAFDRFLETSACDVFMSPFDVTLLNKQNKKNLVQPDLMVLCNWKDDTNERDRYTGIPRLVVEVLSPGNTRKEMMTKLHLYMTSGIEEYWIVDPVLGDVIVYQFSDLSISQTKLFGIDDICSSFIYSDFSFNLKE